MIKVVCVDCGEPPKRIIEAAEGRCGNCGGKLKKLPLTAQNDGLCAELSLILDVFNSCIETKTLPKAGSPCQEKIIELLKRCGKEPTALKVRGA